MQGMRSCVIKIAFFYGTAPLKNPCVRRFDALVSVPIIFIAVFISDGLDAHLGLVFTCQASLFIKRNFSTQCVNIYCIIRPLISLVMCMFCTPCHHSALNSLQFVVILLAVEKVSSKRLLIPSFSSVPHYYSTSVQNHIHGAHFSNIMTDAVDMLSHVR